MFVLYNTNEYGAREIECGLSTNGARIRLNVVPGELVASECGGWVAQKRRCYRRAYRLRADLRLRARRLQLAKRVHTTFVWRQKAEGL